MSPRMITNSFFGALFSFRLSVWPDISVLALFGVFWFFFCCFLLFDPAWFHSVSFWSESQEASSGCNFPSWVVWLFNFSISLFWSRKAVDKLLFLSCTTLASCLTASRRSSRSRTFCLRYLFSASSLISSAVWTDNECELLSLEISDQSLAISCPNFSPKPRTALSISLEHSERLVLPRSLAPPSGVIFQHLLPQLLVVVRARCRSCGR